MTRASSVPALEPAGKVRYTERAFEQDAHEAMRGDIVRGLIELVTNSDDAYIRSSTDGVCRIRVEIEHRRGSSWKVVIRDRASGMSQSEMTDKLANLGARTSGFESGLDVRGNRGRGAKDLAAFGVVTWESISNGQYAALRLHPNGDVESLPRGRPATAEDRTRLGIPRGNGTMATIDVRQSIRCPNHSTLRRQLSSHYQLRGIMTDSRRDVVLENSNSGETDRLSYSVQETEVLRSLTLPIPGYGGASALMQVGRLPERCDDPPSDPYRPCGLLIKGRRAIYENTLFAFESNPYAKVLSGWLTCEYIDQLAQEYDDRLLVGEAPDRTNPIPLISRTRDGLQREHPFYQALRESAEEVLRELVREEEERARREAVLVENERTRRDLDRMAREVARFMEEELRDAEAEGLLTTPALEVKPLTIIPGEVTCYLGQPKTITVAARKDGLPEEAIVQVSTDPEGVVEISDGNSVTLGPHRWRSDLVSGQIHLRPLISDVALIRCECTGRTAEAMVTVVEQEEPPPPIPPPPESLEFERSTYRIAWHRSRTLVLRAPRSTGSATTVTVSSTSPGVAVLTPMVTLVDAGNFLSAGVRIEGRSFGAESRLTAVASGDSAQCRVIVTREEESANLRFEIEDQDAGPYRALWEKRTDPRTEQELDVLIVKARHPGLRRYLGSAPEFPGQNTPWARLVIAEIVADNACREIARRIDARRLPEERPDAEAFYFEHYRRMLRLLPGLQQIQLASIPDWLGQ